MALSPRDRQIWLQERTLLSSLEEATLAALSQHLSPRFVPAQRAVVPAGEATDGLYILESGRVEHGPGVANPRSFLPGSVLYLRSLLLSQPVEATVTTLTDCTFWFLGRDAFQQL
ncbi:MAG: cyclic nucleotide-binding domain-containing protein, partial [Leptolyngbya sp.]|nr:cyclic nucleotide-binding domain-containing protein [Leptolyngbya sp.]